jgi:hypothetical protein
MRWMTRGQPRRARFTGPQSTNDATAERLDRLERANRRLTVALVFLSSVALIAVAVGAKGDGAEWHEAKPHLLEPIAPCEAQPGVGS